MLMQTVTGSTLIKEGTDPMISPVLDATQSSSPTAFITHQPFGAVVDQPWVSALASHARPLDVAGCAEGLPGEAGRLD
jgi:hypothetical protein